MREKYESLSLAVLKDLAKARGMKGISTLRKPALIERMLEEDVKESDRGNPEEVHKSTPAENTVKEKSYDSEKTEYRTRPAGEGLQEQRKEYRSDKNEQEHRSTNIRREYNREYNREATRENGNVPSESTQLDSGEKANGILEVLPDGYGFIRCENYLPGENDIYVSPSQIRRFNLKTGDIIKGNIRIKTQGEKFSALLYVTSINGFHPSEGQRRYNFEDMTPIFPNERLIMERPGGTVAMRIVDLISPIGKGQRGMIVSPPKAGKTTLLKDVAKSILRNNPDMHLIILLIDERPEEVTDIKEEIKVVKERDPAIKSDIEVLLYPSFKVMLHYRIAHKLYLKKHYFLARWVSQRGVRKTGIEIHPGATIGKGLFIDHGSGVIIGETAILGDNITLYQGVTLGALSTRQGQQLADVKRHPTIGDNVTIYSNSTVLGGETVIGENTIIGGNTFITSSIPANTKVSAKSPELVIKKPRNTVSKADVWDWEN